MRNFSHITYKNYPVDKEVEMTKDIYWALKGNNVGKHMDDKTPIRYDAKTWKYYKTDKKGGRKKLYVLPY